MKKIKYRNNNYNNQVYSINYKFDSISPAGKCSGTALDLIKKYNELAKEAHSNGNYIEAEVFRQYAEHYRKIVTEINERKNIRFNNKEEPAKNLEEEVKDTPMPQTNADDQTAQPQENSLVETKQKTKKKAFTVIDASNDKPTHRKYKPRAKQNSEEVPVNE